MFLYFDKEDIDSKFLKLIALIKKTGISKSKISDNLAWGELYGHILYVNQSGIYRDDDFERLLISKCLEECKEASKLQAGLSRELHIISTPLATGGHTRLMEKIIGLRKDSDVLVARAVTDIEKKLRLSCESKVYYNEFDFEIFALVEIISKYKTIFLHIDPDDLLTSVAVGVVKKLKSIQVIFVNHADHVFSYGYYCSDIVAEVSSYGFFLSQKKRNVGSSFLGIPLDLSHLKEMQFDLVNKNNHFFEIFTAGSRGKYKPNQKLSFSILAKILLKEMPTARLTVVGPTIWTDWWWWKAKLRNPIRLKILSSLPYEEYISTLDCADIYLDSFPMTGGTALPEIRSRGIPVSGLLSDSFGYTPFDATKFSNVNCLVSALKNYAFNKKGEIADRNNNQDINLNAFFVHGFDAVSSRLDAMINSRSLFRPYDDKTIFNIDFYRNQWLSEGVIKLDLRSLDFLIKNRSSGGWSLIFMLSRLIRVRQIAGLLARLLVRSLSH